MAAGSGKARTLTTTAVSTSGKMAGGLWDPTGTMPRDGAGALSYFYRDAAPPGKSGFRMLGFRSSSGNKEIIRERRQAVNNAREADRNNTAVRAGITKRAVDMVGKSLKLQSLPNFEALGIDEETAMALASRWENEFSLWGDDPRKLNDAARHDQFGAQMYGICRNTYGADGEAALVIRYDRQRQRRYGARRATFVEAMDPDRLTNPDGLPDSDNLCQGRQLDPWGGYEGLWFERNHPDDARGVRSWDYVPRETARGRPIGVHWFPRYRAGAQRAMPAILGSLRDVRMLDTFDQKTLEAAVKAAFMAIVIKTKGTTAEMLAKIQGAPTGDPARDFLMGQNARFSLYEDWNVEGQAVPVMAPDDEMQAVTASQAGLDTDSFRFAFERKFSNLLGLSYARFSNDYSKTSFASIRAEFIDTWRMTMADRYEFCSSVPALVAVAHFEDCYLDGVFNDILPANAPDFYDEITAYTQCEFRGPAMGWVDPVKDATASGMRIARGQSSPQAEAAAAGGDFYDNVDQIARAQAYAIKKLGARIEFDPASQQTRVTEQVDENGNPIEPASGSADTGGQAGSTGGAPTPKE